MSDYRDVARLVRAAEEAIGELADGSVAAAKLALAARLLKRNSTVEVKTGPDVEPWHGVRVIAGESWTYWRVFPASTSDEDAAEALGFPREYYLGPGRAFGRAPWFRRRGSRLLVTCSGGLDV